MRALARPYEVTQYIDATSSEEVCTTTTNIDDKASQMNQIIKIVWNGWASFVLSERGNGLFFSYRQNLLGKHVYKKKSSPVVGLLLSLACNGVQIGLKWNDEIREWEKSGGWKWEEKKYYGSGSCSFEG